jgi:hypothetical protein
MRKPPAGAVCSMRAAMCTVTPRMLPSASTPPPSRTPPEWMPTRTSKPAWPCRRSTSVPRAGPHRAGRGRRARPVRVVLLGALGTEHREQAVAGVLQDLAAVATDDRGAADEQAVDHRLQVLGIELAGERGRADDVEEQHTDMGEAGRLRRRLALERCELGAQRRDRRIDDGVAERGALRLERGDRRLDPVRSLVHAPNSRTGLAPGSGRGRRRRRPVAS